MPAADRAPQLWRLGVTLLAVVLGMVLGAFLSGGFSSSSGASAAQPIGPDVGDIRISPGPAGPTATVEGVGVGFARTEAGAVAAATNLVLTLEQASSTDRARAIRHYELLSAEGSRESLAADMAAGWDALHQTLTANGPRTASLFLRTVPIGHNVVRYSDDRATVAVWTLTLLATDGMAQPLASFETATVEVVWEGGDWKIWSAQSDPGPSLAWVPTATTGTEPFLATVEALEGYRYVAS